MVQAPSERFPDGLDAKLALLFAQLESQRVLLVLDNLESILAAGEDAGNYREGFDSYRQLSERMAHGHHQSCLLITSRRCLRVSAIGGRHLHIRHLSLVGLSPEQGTELLDERKVKGPGCFTFPRHSLLWQPIGVKAVASTVNDLYAGDIEPFLTSGALVFDDIRSVLDQQFARLSEYTGAWPLLVWLAINREPVRFDELWHDLVASPSRLVTWRRCAYSGDHRSSRSYQRTTLRPAKQTWKALDWRSTMW